MSGARSVLNASRYLLEYYSSRDPADDQGAAWLLRCFTRAYHQIPQDLTVLEFGGGPSLYTGIIAAPRSRFIDWCDFSPTAIEEVQAWRSRHPASYDWGKFTTAILQSEGMLHPNESDICARHELLRRRLDRVFTCDAFAEDQLLGYGRPTYDVVCNNGCLDSITSDCGVWIATNERLVQRVGPGGYYITAATVHGTEWHVGDQVYPAVTIDRNGVLDLYTKMNLQVLWSDEIALDRTGYAGMSFVIGHR